MNTNNTAKQNNAVLVTGMSAVTAAGLNLDSSWQAIMQQQSAIKSITTYDSSEWEYPLGAEVTDYNPRVMLQDRKLLKVISRHDVIGIYAAQQAIAASRIPATQQQLGAAVTEFNERTGIIVASPGNKFYQQYDFMPVFKDEVDGKPWGESIFSNVHPMWLLRILPNNVLAYVGIQNGFKGANHNITNHGASGLQAISEAAALIRAGTLERCIVVGYDNAIDPQNIQYYGSLGVISKQGLKPYAADASGTVFGEGAAALVLESAASASHRDARSYAEILGASTVAEGQGTFALESTGVHLERCITQTLQQSACTVDDIELIVGHANGNQRSDHIEAKVIVDNFAATPVTGFKWAVGHTIAAAGVLETALTIKALQEQRAPGVPGTEHLAPSCSGLAIGPDHQAINGDHALVINRGFAGMDSALCLRAINN